MSIVRCATQINRIEKLHSGSEGAWILSHESQGTRQGIPWIGCQSIEVHKNPQTFDNLEMAISLQCMSMDWGKKLGYLEEAQGEQTNESNI